MSNEISFILCSGIRELGCGFLRWFYDRAHISDLRSHGWLCPSKNNRKTQAKQSYNKSHLKTHCNMMFNANRFMQIESRFFSLASVLFVLEYINRFISRGKQFFTVVNARNTFTKIPPRWAESVCVCVCSRVCL